MKYVYIIALMLVFASCEKEVEPLISQFENPASQLGSEPNLHLTEDGTIYFSWIEAVKEKNSKLFISTLNESKLTWSTPILIAEGKDWFVNWADFPSITSFGENSLAAHYLDKSADDTYAYDVKLKLSNDGGITWNNSFIPHNDNTKTEHGFVSKVDMKDNTLLSVWLDGRKYAYSEKDSNITKEMTLRSAIINSKNELLKEFELDGRVCDCCQTDSAMTENGPIVVYRDRSDKEIRDISYVRYINDEWTEPKAVHNDNWSIFGCPVNGPAISTMKNNAVVAWFTSANDNQKVKIAFSSNNGETFETPILVDQLKPSGRVDIELLKDGSALMSWLDNKDETAIIQLQRVYPNGNKGIVLTLSESSESRSSGFPRMIIKDFNAYLAWTNSGDTLTVKTVKININAMLVE